MSRIIDGIICRHGRTRMYCSDCALQTAPPWPPPDFYPMKPREGLLGPTTLPLKPDVCKHGVYSPLILCDACAEEVAGAVKAFQTTLTPTEPTMKMDEALLTKIRVGDGLTDEELSCALAWYTDLEAKLKLLGAEYRLAWQPIFMKLMEMKDWKRSREERKKR